jgi:hypothetical protein
MASCSDAATYLFDAWRNNDRQKARRVATREAVDALQWGVPGPPPVFQGCSPNAVGCDCAYTYEGGSMHFHVAGDGDGGYYVETVSFVPD